MTQALAVPAPRARRPVLAFALCVAAAAGTLPVSEAASRAVSVIVVSRDAGAAETVARANGGRVEASLPIVDGVWARIPESRIDDVSRAAMVFADRPLRVQSASYGGSLTTAYPHEVGATRSWARGVTGAGVTVALVDTGVADVPDLAGRVVARANFSREASFGDEYGHGTFQAGLIGGDGASSSGRYVGVAPEAGIMSVKVAGRDGSTSLGQVLSGIQLVDHSASRFNVRVLLLALSSESPLPPELDPLSVALRAAWSHGIVVVVPAGNDGPEPGSIAAPGEDPVLLTAASVDDAGTPDVEDDTVSAFSGRGPTRWGAEKPEVAAPGQHLISLRAPGSAVDEENPAARVESAYFKGSGTSMAAAVTAGAAALLLSERPSLSPDQVKATLTGSAHPVPAGDADSVGAGVVDADAAATLAATAPELPAGPDLGPPAAPFTPPGLRYDWVGDDGATVWAATRGDGRAREGDEEFEARQWAARQWAARQWNARQWSARQWAERDWEARQWAARQWAARQWAARQWNARQWSARQWADEAWAARQWAARQWSEEEWSARQWSARQWSARQWSARQWSARQWSDEEWEARQWSARQWSARQWSARQWSDDEWEARQWSARQWSARQWSARQWSTAAWG